MSAEEVTARAGGEASNRRCHTTILEHEATAIIPIRKNGRLWWETARPQSRETQSSATFAKKALKAGNGGAATMPAAEQRRRCAA
jgi:hypothetical protein